MLYLQGVIKTPAVRQPLKRFSTEERAQIEAYYGNSVILRRDRV
jgi:N-acetylneuraminate lyase